MTDDITTEDVRDTFVLAICDRSFSLGKTIRDVEKDAKLIFDSWLSEREQSLRDGIVDHIDEELSFFEDAVGAGEVNDDPCWVSGMECARDIVKGVS